MTRIRPAALLLLLPLLSACATDRYWYEPPPADQAPATVAGTWQGLIRHDFSQRVYYGAVAGGVGVRCARYQDLVTLDASGGNLEVQIGRSSTIKFSTAIGASGEFRQQLPVQGDTWIYGGIGIYSNEPTLTVWGRLDPITGTGTGHLSVTPGPKERIGCYATFHVSRNAGPPPPEQLGEPFMIRYWMDQLDKGDDNEFWMVR